jgi:D-alanyl-D-alanine carboxypeptidase
VESKLSIAPSVFAYVDAPLDEFRWYRAVGMVERGGQDPVTVDDGFRIASMSKTFTGILIAQLMEQGKVQKQDAAIDHLPEEIARLLRVPKGYESRDVTIAHLLHHRSGFDDFVAHPEWRQEIFQDPDSKREPEETARWALAHTSFVGGPGDVHHYSDTNYVLLGLIAQHLTGEMYHELCRTRIFNPLGMDATWLEGHETPRCRIAHAYTKTSEDNWHDAMVIHGSFDWAAGGHVSTLSDLACFLRGAFNGRLFEQIETLDQMLSGPPAIPGFCYAMGLGRKQIHGKNLWGHLGHWGSFFYYCPEERLSLCGTQNYFEYDHNAFILEMLERVFPD